MEKLKENERLNNIIKLLFIVASIMYLGGIPIMVLLVMFSIYILIKSNIKYNKKSNNEREK